jgi:hypothetical protein
MFKGQQLNEAMGVPFFYGVCEAFFVSIYCVICWKAGWSKAPSDASLWTVISTTYEVLEAEMKSICEIEVSISSSSSDGNTERPVEVEDGMVLTTYFPMADKWTTAALGNSSPKEPSGHITITRTPASDDFIVSYPQQIPQSGSSGPRSVRSINESNSGLFHAEC